MKQKKLNNQPQFKGINGISASAFYSAIEHGNTEIFIKNQEEIKMLRTNSKKAMENIRAYIEENFDCTSYDLEKEPETFLVQRFTFTGKSISTTNI